MTAKDAGLYTCTIQNATGSSQASAELEVLGQCLLNSLVIFKTRNLQHVKSLFLNLSL